MQTTDATTARPRRVPPPGTHHAREAQTLDDRQAVIIAMASTGRSCREMADELSLPLRAIQGHLYRALEILGIKRLEDLTPEAVTSQVGDPRLPDRTSRNCPVGPVSTPDVGEILGPGGDDEHVSVLVLLDRAEAAASGSRAPRVPLHGGDELTAIRALLDQQGRTILQLHRAVASRDLIGQAKGILMERHKISADAAFARLQSESCRTNRRLVSVAESLIYTGQEADTGMKNGGAPG